MTVRQLLKQKHSSSPSPLSQSSRSRLGQQPRPPGLGVTARREALACGWLYNPLPFLADVRRSALICSYAQQLGLEAPGPRVGRRRSRFLAALSSPGATWREMNGVRMETSPRCHSHVVTWTDLLLLPPRWARPGARLVLRNLLRAIARVVGLRKREHRACGTGNSRSPKSQCRRGSLGQNWDTTKWLWNLSCTLVLFPNYSWSLGRGRWPFNISNGIGLNEWGNRSGQRS